MRLKAKISKPLLVAWADEATLVQVVMCPQPPGVTGCQHPILCYQRWNVELTPGWGRLHEMGRKKPRQISG